MTDRAFRPLRLSVSVSVSDSRSHETLRRTLCLGLCGATRSLASHVSHMFCSQTSLLQTCLCCLLLTVSRIATPSVRGSGARTDVPQRRACTLPLRAAGGCSC